MNGTRAGLQTSGSMSPVSNVALDDSSSRLEVLSPLCSSHPTCVFRIDHVEWSDPSGVGECEARVCFSGDRAGWSMRVGYVNGKKHGAASVYYPDGIVYLNVGYVDDVCEGEYRLRDENGIVVEEGRLKHGKRHGFAKGDGVSGKRERHQ